MVLSGLVFGGVTFASSGAGSLLQNSRDSLSEVKVPDVQQITTVEISPSPAASAPVKQTPKKSNVSTQQPIPTPSPLPVVSAVPKQPTVSSLVPPVPTPAAARIVVPQAQVTTPKLSSQTNIADFNQDSTENDEENSEENEDGEDNSELSSAFRRAGDDD